MAEVKFVSTKAGTLPLATSTMIRLVGVGRTSRGPTGAEGFTITAGNPLVGYHVGDEPFSGNLAALVGADSFLFRHGISFICGTAVCRQGKCGHAACIDNALYRCMQRLSHDRASPAHIGRKDFIWVPRPQSVVGRNVEDIFHILHGAFNGCGHRVRAAILQGLISSSAKVISATKPPSARTE
jgi:hypothetical protein